jgi:hypothetical protein
MFFPEVAALTLPNAFFGIDRACISVRLKDDRVYVAADSVHECDEHAAFLITLARRYRLPMIRINNFLYSSILGNFDTAPVDLEAEQFTFRAMPNELGEVPSPGANVDFVKAIIASRRDAMLCSGLLKRGATLAELVAISRNQRRWAAWFAARHIDPEVRAGIASAIAQHDELAEENAEKASRLLERRGKLNA